MPPKELQEGPPKTDAGRRVVSLPPHVLSELERHLEVNVRAGKSSLVFTSPDGTLMRRSNFNRRVWQPACKAMGLRGFHLHDLRHTGNTFAASTGASTKELMARMGHSSPRAALIYQHATRDRDRVLADAHSKLAGEPVQNPPRLSLVDDAEDQWCISGAFPPDGGPAKDVTKGKSPNHKGWRRWDSNPRPPACKFDRGVRGRTAWRVWPDEWRSWRSLNSRERQRMFPKCFHSRIRAHSARPTVTGPRSRS